MRSALDYYNTNSKTLSRDQKINELAAQVEDLKSVLGRNMTLLIERETRIDRLMEKSQQTRRDSLIFKRKSIRLKREARSRSIKLTLLMILGFVFLCVIIYFIGRNKGWWQAIAGN